MGYVTCLMGQVRQCSLSAVRIFLDRPNMMVSPLCIGIRHQNKLRRNQGKITLEVWGKQWYAAKYMPCSVGAREGPSVCLASGAATICLKNRLCL